MEMYIVHAHTDTKDRKNHYLVIGLLFKMGETNKFIDQIPKKEHTEREVTPGNIKLQDLIKKVSKWSH